MCIWDDVPQTTNDFYPFAIMCGVYLVSNEMHISCAYHMCISIGGVRATLEDDHILCHELGEGFYTPYKYDLKHQVQAFLLDPIHRITGSLCQTTGSLLQGHTPYQQPLKM